MLIFTGVTDVSSPVFMALNRNAGAPLRRGTSSYGGDCATLTFTGVIDVYSIHFALTATSNTTGAAQCRGDSSLEETQVWWHVEEGVSTPSGSVRHTSDVDLVSFTTAVLSMTMLAFIFSLGAQSV